MGDGMLVYFGYPHATRTTQNERCILDWQFLDAGEGAQSKKKPTKGINIAARIGIATGQVVVGELLGQESAKERSAFGKCPNLAARLQGLAKPNQLTLTSNEATRGQSVSGLEIMVFFLSRVRNASSNLGRF